MSGWIDEQKAGWVPRQRGNPGSEYRTDCKIGKHPIMKDDPTVWVTDAAVGPLGLSCVECVTAATASASRAALDLAR